MKTLSDIHLAVVSPMANEGADGVRFAREVLTQVDPIGRVTFFAVLDNATRDNTRELLEEYAKSEPRLRVIWAPENRCVVDAYVRGYNEALKTDADWILEIDAGFSHDPRQIPRFFQPMLDGYDCAFGSRFIKGGGIKNSSPKRYCVSYGGTLLTNLFIGTKLHDMTSGFEMFTRKPLEDVLRFGIHSRAHFFQTEIKIYCRNLKVAEVPITYQMASPGMSTGPVNEAFVQLWRLFKLRLRGKLVACPGNTDAKQYQPSDHLYRSTQPSAAQSGSRLPPT
jgi:dolichol-phosphate mannosyltransferase